MLEYREIEPHASLRPFLSCFWTINSAFSPVPPKFSRILPDGCVDIIFNLGDSLIGAEPHGDRDDEVGGAFVVGVMRSSRIVGMSGAVNIMGIRFLPGAAAVFLGLTLFELTDRRVLLDNFWRHDAAEAVGRLAEAKSMTQRLAILEKSLLGRLKHVELYDERISKAVNYIYLCGGQVSLKELQRLTGLSARQLERKFNTYVGLGPKLFSRIIRFKRVLAAMSGQNESLASLAYLSGYSDQSHFIKEFKTFSGLIPTDFISKE